MFITGRRKSSTATIELIKGSGNLKINNKHYADYFQNQFLLMKIFESPFEKAFLEYPKKHDLNIKVMGGGLISQACAIRLALAKLLRRGEFDTFLQLPRVNPNMIHDPITPKTTLVPRTRSSRPIPSSQDNKLLFKSENYLTRDPRVKERRKYGRKKARKSPQFSKR